MATRIMIPTPLRVYTGNLDAVEVEGETVGDALDNLTRSYAELKKHLYDEQGKLRSFVNVYLNDEDIRYLDRDATAVTPDDTISIIPSVAGGSVAEPVMNEEIKLTHEEVTRYSRHLIMPEVGMEGQRKLRAARVVCIGAGGLGSPATLYLAAAGVGTLGLVDFDTVELSNLQRQIIHGTSNVGRPKLESAAERLGDVNPHVEILQHETPLRSENALDILADYDVVIDGTDNFPTRYLVNDACVLLGKPNVYGSIFRFDGQASVFATTDGPCYRCLYPDPPPPGLVPSCAEGGVLGVLPGIIGTIQATEAIKLIIGKGESLAGRLLVFDALRMKFRELKLRKNEECPVCGPNPTVTELIDYEEFCGIRGEEGVAPETEFDVEPRDVAGKLESGNDLLILDVREPHEAEINRIESSTLIPLRELPERVRELDSSREIIAHCRSGVRSAKAVEFLRGAGFRKAWNLKGGILLWIDQVDPSQPKY